jgi:hypothetical protein
MPRQILIKRSQKYFTKTYLAGFKLFHTEGRTDGQSLQRQLPLSTKFENSPKRFRDAKHKNQGMNKKFQ